MTKDLIVRAPPPSDHLHPLVHVAIVGLVLVFTGSAFVAFPTMATPVICSRW
ncbi:MAG: hypothetical protein RO009_15035 [Pseudorhodoplanes sp.]|jgi:hypothetical protein|nr:hypothetical protein [Pseudorhodoplanes sp.]